MGSISTRQIGKMQPWGGTEKLHFDRCQHVDNVIDAALLTGINFIEYIEINEFYANIA